MKGWDRYRGDFSNKGASPQVCERHFNSDTADQKSLYTTFKDHEIMY
jgi:hypothetical protein